MRFPVAVLMIALGYAFVYWSLERIFVFGPSDGSPSTRNMEAVPLVTLLMGNTGAGATTKGSSLPPVHMNVQNPTVQPATNNSPTTPNNAPNPVVKSV